ncbi:hypothetical protein Plhal304r1_c017g0062901 [Plasmopara halstedii]
MNAICVSLLVRAPLFSVDVKIAGAFLPHEDTKGRSKSNASYSV